MKNQTLNDFPIITHDKIRYSDTDAQGHVNNANFSSFLETGRVEILYNHHLKIIDPNASFVIANLQIDFIREIMWPGQVDIGTGIVKVGKSSITIRQSLFQNEVCVANSTSVIVQVDNQNGKSLQLSKEAHDALSPYILS